MDGSEINGESEEEEEVEEGDEEEEKVNGYISAGDLAKRKEKREVGELFEEGWEGVGLLDRIRAFRILADDALDSLSEGLLRYLFSLSFVGQSFFASSKT